MDFDHEIPELLLAGLHLHPTSSGQSASASRPAGSGCSDYQSKKEKDIPSVYARDNEEDYDDDDMDDADDEVLPVDNVLCFFCSEESSPKDMLSHCVSRHNIDLSALVKTYRLPTEEIIKMVNYIRKTRPTAEQLQSPVVETPMPYSQTAKLLVRCESITAGAVPSSASVLPSGFVGRMELWRDDEWMLPVMPADHGITSLLIWDWDNEDGPSEPFPSPEHFPTTNPRFNDAADLVENSPSVNSSCRDALDSGRTANIDRVLNGTFFKPDADQRNKQYFDSYSGFSIHCEMLRDAVRTASYKKAISDTVNGKSVLDVGCGSGVLSCFAAEAGAKEVVAVDKADIIDYAHEIAIENMLGDKIRFIHTDLDQADLAIDKVDVIISEWMGYFLLFEGMLDSVIRARDTYLAENGTMIPSTATLYMCAISDDESWQSRVGLWDSAYGLQFGCLKKYSLMYPAVEEVSSDKVVTDRCSLRKWDLLRCTVEDTEFETQVLLQPNKTCSVTALVGFFDVGYGGTFGVAMSDSVADEGSDFSGEKVMFCTSPNDPVTHWAQSVFYLNKPFPIREGHPVILGVEITKSPTDHRGLDVSFQLRGAENLEANGSGDADASGAMWRQSYQL